MDNAAASDDVLQYVYSWSKTIVNDVHHHKDTDIYIGSPNMYVSGVEIEMM